MGFDSPRYFRFLNLTGLIALYRKEVLRFLNVYIQTIFAPMVTSIMFLAIFILALERALLEINGVPFAHFLAPGLIIMSMVQNAFANSSSSIVSAKMQGNIVDVLMPPISAFEFLIAHLAACLTRAIVVGVATSLGMMIFIDITIEHFLYLLWFGLLGSLMLGLIGIIAGIWAQKFDHISAITNFLVAPMTFLSGTFYSIHNLPEPFFTISQLNPFFYMIDGFRAGFIGVSDGSLWIGSIFLGVMNIGYIILTYIMLKTGYKLKN
ncbi:MAG: ABC transporter permease [Pseudomonadota bacterium]